MNTRKCKEMKRKHEEGDEWIEKKVTKSVGTLIYDNCDDCWRRCLMKWGVFLCIVISPEKATQKFYKKKNNRKFHAHFHGICFGLQWHLMHFTFPFVLLPFKQQPSPTSFYYNVTRILLSFVNSSNFSLIWAWKMRCKPTIYGISFLNRKCCAYVFSFIYSLAHINLVEMI